jgi:hypothetical protein
MMDTWWKSDDNTTDYGSVTNGTNTPEQTALLGTQEGGGLDTFGNTCYNGGSSANPPNTLEFITYTSATMSCTPKTPLPKGTYSCTNGQGLKHTGVTETQTVCNGIG